MTKKKCVIFGNCQATAITQILSEHEPFASRFEILPIKPVYEMIPQDGADLEAKMEDVSLFIGQDIAHTRLPPGTRALVSKMKDGQALLFPVAWFNAYNPDMVAAEPGRFGHYHSKTIMDAFADGASEEEALKRFERPMDKSEVIANLESNLSELRRREAVLDIAISDELESRLQSSQLFYTYNHPAAPMQHFIADEVLRRIELPPLDAELKAKWSHLLNSIQWPLNQGVHEALGLTFPRPEKFWFDGAYYEPADFIAGNYAFYRQQAAAQ